MSRCPACRSEVDAWSPGPGGRPNARCPRCGALERHRFLAVVLHDLRLYLRTASAVLEYAPQPQMQKLLRAGLGPDGTYVGIDLMDHRFVDCSVDACFLPFADDSIDLLVQFHVLEHIPDDAAAMREMARVLSPGGLAIVQVPCRRGRSTDEDPDAPEHERIERFGQADHVRYYGADYDDRLRANGLRVTYFEARDVIGATRREQLNILERDPLWICRPA